MRRGDAITPPGSTSDLCVVVGLGNPGRQYLHSRHNVGFRCLDLVAQRHQVQLADRRRNATIGQGHIEDRPVVLAKPRTFMNRSGRAVRYLLDRFHGGVAQLLIVADDMDLPLGRLRLRPSGSSGGHLGLQSIIDELGSQDFPRLRIGIGRPGGATAPVAHVLGKFSSAEQLLEAEAVERAAQALVVFLAEGIETAMNRFN